RIDLVARVVRLRERRQMVVELVRGSAEQRVALLRRLCLADIGYLAEVAVRLQAHARVAGADLAVLCRSRVDRAVVPVGARKNERRAVRIEIDLRRVASGPLARSNRGPVAVGEVDLAVEGAVGAAAVVYRPAVAREVARVLRRVR